MVIFTFHKSRLFDNDMINIIVCSKELLKSVSVYSKKNIRSMLLVSNLNLSYYNIILSYHIRPAKTKTHVPDLDKKMSIFVTIKNSY
jgi:hypothetical protein